MARNEALAARKLAEQEKSIAESARQNAERSAAQALADRQRAEQSARMAELRLADSLIAQGDAMAIASRWVEAKQLYRQAGQSLTTMGTSAEEADLGLMTAYRVAPPPLMTFISRHGAVRSTALSPDNRFGASGAADNTITLWDLLTGCELHTLSGHAQPVKCLAFSPDGNRLLSVSTDGVAESWDARTGLPMLRLGWAQDRRELEGNVSFTSDGKIAIAASAGRILTWDASFGKLLGAAEAHRGRVLSTAISSDDRWLVTIGTDGMLKLWALKPLREIRTLDAEDEPVQAACLTADNRRVVAVNSSGRVSVFNLGRPARYREFRARLDETGQLNDPPTLKLLGTWYAFRGRWDWAAELLEEAQRGGRDVSPLLLARCRWLAGDRQGANREFAAAKDRNEAPIPYLDLCIRAVSSKDD